MNLADVFTACRDGRHKETRMLTSGKMRIALGEGRSQQGGEPSEHFVIIGIICHLQDTQQTEEMISEELKDNIILYFP